MRRKLFIITCVAIFLIGICYGVFAVSRRGSSGSEVRQIQEKLKRWGYYNGSIDGVYGSRTEEAVKSFQRKNGLTADGIAGRKTLNAMGIYSSSSSGGSSSNDLSLLSKVVYSESRGEPYTGQVAVASIVLNRVKSSSFPNTVAGVSCTRCNEWMGSNLWLYILF